MVRDFWPFVQVAPHRHHVVENVIGLLKQACRVAVLLACIVGGESVFGHA
jgi:hypothetical protein